MKNLLAALLIVGATSLNAAAWDTKLNPDRVPSLGLDYNRYYANGVLNAIPINVPGIGNTTQINFTGIGQTNVIADLRVPISNYVTFGIHGGPTWMDYQGVPIQGWQGGASMRMYFQGQ